MFTDNSLSSVPAPSNFIGARREITQKKIDKSDGGISIRDPSRGLFYQIWTAQVESNLDLETDDIMVSAANYPAFSIYQGWGITEISLAFDLSCNPIVAFVEKGVSKVRWWDSSIRDYTTTEVGEHCLDPKVCLDEPRSENGINSDVILAYLKDAALYFRMQRDLYQIEYLLDEGPFLELQKLGLGALRLQFQVIRP